VPEPASELPAFDRYQVLAHLGRGGFASVYLARHAVTGHEVALKVSDPGGDPELVSRALNEARVAASLRHPSLAQIFDSGTLADGRIFVAMERIDGPSLDALLTREGGRIDPRRAARFGVDLLSALELVHARGVVHRDVKPANLVVRRDPVGTEQIVLIDFGISKISPAFGGGLEGGSPATMLGAALGTPGYMAPEQLDARSVDARADLYGVAAVLYRAIAGRKPYEVSTLEAFARALHESASPPLSQLAPWTPPALALVIDRALARDRDARPPNARAMRDALASALAGESAGPIAPTATLEVVTPLPTPSAIRAVVPMPYPPVATGDSAPASREDGVSARFVAFGFLAVLASVAIGWTTVKAIQRATPRVAVTVAAPTPIVIANGPAPVPTPPPSALAELPEEKPSQRSNTSRRDEAPAARDEDTVLPSSSHAATEGASDVAPVRSGRRVRYLGARGVGAIDMGEIEGFVRRAIGRIDGCYSGAEPRRSEHVILFNTNSGPLVSPISDRSDVGRCVSSALVAVIPSGGTRSQGVLRDIVFSWE